MQCSGTTLAGQPCRRPVKNPNTVCHTHQPRGGGRLYVLSNPRMTVLKIGMTRGTALERARALATTGVPAPFVVEHETGVFDDPEALEASVFALLAGKRVTPTREFFDATVAEAITAISAATGAPAEDDHVIDVADGVDEITLRFGPSTSIRVTRPAPQ